eukprot:Clim_evm16s218 gene=Clim_evmTU16s218
MSMIAVALTALAVPTFAEVRVGTGYDVTLEAFDGENNVFTVWEPSAVDTEAVYPVVLHSHGYGGSRDSDGSNEFNLALREAGYYVVSIDERGHGDSGGFISTMSPDKEGKNLLQIIEFVRSGGSTEAPIALKTDCATGTTDNTDCVGSIGGSYGGMYQLLLSSIDAEGTIKAMVPEIFPYDLTRALHQNEVYKSVWGALLAFGGNSASEQGQDPYINEGNAQGAATGTLPQDKIDAFLYQSFRYFCEPELDGVGMDTIPEDSGFVPSGDYSAGTFQGNTIMGWNSPFDHLFDLNQEALSLECNDKAGGRSIYMTYGSGHGTGVAYDPSFELAGGDAVKVDQNCGPVNRAEATMALFAEYLMNVPGAYEDYVVSKGFPQSDDDLYCHYLGVGMGAVTPVMPNGGTPTTIPEEDNIVIPGSEDVTVLPLITLTEDAALAGKIPATITVSPADGGDHADEPLIFVGLSKSGPDTDGSESILSQQVMPIRGYGTYDMGLIMVTDFVKAGETLNLWVSGKWDLLYSGVSGTGTAPVAITGSVELPLLTGDDVAVLDSEGSTVFGTFGMVTIESAEEPEDAESDKQVGQGDYKNTSSSGISTTVIGLASAGAAVGVVAIAGVAYIAHRRNTGGGIPSVSGTDVQRV